MKLLISFQIAIVAAVMLLITPNVNGDTDRKQEIGEKLATAIKTDVNEVFESIVTALKGLSENLLKEAKPTALKAERLERDILDYEKFNKERYQMTPEQLLSTAKRFMKERYEGYWFMGRPITYFYENADFAKQELRNTVDACSKATEKFAMSIYDNWTELYETLSKEELAQHAEYEQINELMEGIKRTNGKGTVFLDAVKALIRFFEYENWYFFLEIENL